MNLHQLLINGRNNSFRMINKSYFYLNKQVREPNYNQSILTEDYFGSQLAVLIEYYLKGILLPVLDINVPEDNEKIKRLSQELTDEQKYRIIISDDTIYEELSRLYGNKYKLNKGVIKKLGDESLKIFSHDLFKLASKIITKAKEGKFNSLSNNSTNDYDSYLIETLTPLLEILNKNEIKNAFPKGRYGFLDGYIADKNTLDDLLNKIRKIANSISNGIILDLYDSKSEQKWCIDEYVFFPDNLNKIFIQDEIRNNSRVYRYDNGKLFLEYGLEEEVELDRKYNGYVHHSASYYNQKDSSIDFFYEADRNLKIEQGQYVFFIDKDEKISGFLKTNNGKIEEDREPISTPTYEYEREQQVVFEFGDKLRSDFEKKFTQELIEYGTNYNMELSQLSKLGKKYIKYLNANDKLRGMKREYEGYKSQQKARRTYGELYHSSKKFEYKRPGSSEFRKAYVDYVGSSLSYRVERGHQYFNYIVQYMKKGTNMLSSAIQELSSEEKQEMKQEFKQMVKDDIKDFWVKENRNDNKTER